MGMMWTDLTADWGLWFSKMQSRFPHLEDSAMPFVKQDRTRFEAYLAGVHNLSMEEAREEIEDFMFVESLALEAAGATP